MKIQTFSVIAGSEACNARCPFCVSKMTPAQGVGLKEPEVNWRNFKIAANLALQCGVTTVMLTGKGEPTLFPDQLTSYLEALRTFAFPFVELQSNGIRLLTQKTRLEPYLQEWYELGLTTIAVSIVHQDAEKNREVYLPHKRSYIDLAELIDHLHTCGLSVRLACILAGGYIDDVDGLVGLIEFARECGVEQLTVRPINRPTTSRSSDASGWADQHHLTREGLAAIAEFLEREGNLLMKLVHGALIYDVRGQNVCLSDSLTLTPSGDIRQLIFFPDGHLRYDWQHKGAILL